VPGHPAGGDVRRARSGGWPAFLVKDINTTPVQNRLAISNNGPFDDAALAVRGDALYFTANSGQLWKSDGTAAGTTLVKDLHPYALFYDFEFMNGVLFFTVADSASGIGLWRSDGTSAGTVPVKIFDSVWNGDLINVNETLFFAADGGDGAGPELWKSDGTADGTMRVAGINPGDGGSNLTQLTNVNGTLFFTAMDGAGDELWKSDGTAAGTVRVRDINPGAANSSPLNLEPVGGILFFMADDGTSGYELWKSDGTTAGTHRVKDINRGAADSPYYDGIEHMVDVNGMLFFIASAGGTTSLWKSDGTTAGTLLVKELRFDTAEVIPPYAVVFLTNLNGTLFFMVVDDTSGPQLWKSDGTAAGTVRVIAPTPEPGSSGAVDHLTSFHGQLFFLDGPPFNLWRSDGSAAGTMPLLPPIAATAPSAPENLVDVGGKVFFSADDGRHGRELWQSDGTAAGTTQVKDIAAGEVSAYFYDLTNVNGTLFFVAWDQDNHSALWKSDGTTAGTVRVRETQDNGQPSFPGDLTNLNGELFFTAYDAAPRRTIWKSDGTDAGTVPVAAINNAFEGDPSQLTSANGTLFFAVGDTDGGRQLWKSDGTTAGTTQLKAFETPPPWGCTRLGCYYPPNLDHLTRVGDRLFFNAYGSATDFELWTSDGTPAGTVLVKDIVPGPRSSQVADLTDLNGTLFFSAYEPGSGRELWKSNGTTAGTVRVLDLAPGPESSAPSALASGGGKLFFAASDGIHGSELWQSDGTAAGTKLVQDIVPGPAGSNPAGLAFAGGRLFFNADDGHTGQELWAVNTGQDAYLQMPTIVGAAPGGVAAIPVHYGNHGLVDARTRALTATLDPALTYLGDTSGITPTISGQTLTWRRRTARRARMPGRCA
jgi:ELWxxDGT repeat protein